MQVLVTEEAVLHLDDMTDDQFFAFCVRNSEYRIERAADGKVIILSGTGGRTGNRNSDLTAQIHLWARADGRGVAFDSSTLFRLPNGAMRSPDASWVSRQRLASLSEREKEKYLPLCPEFVVELTSPSDQFPAVAEKMAEWIANGCLLGWILDTRQRQVHIYRPSGVEVVQQAQGLAGDEPVEGLLLELSSIWDPGW